MTFSGIYEEIKCECSDDDVRFEFDGLCTVWMSRDDSFIERIQTPNLNQSFIRQHIRKEIEIRNILDEGITFLNSQKYAKAIERFDNVIFYDEEYGEALINKSHALFGQRHFVKALRYYRCAVRASDDLEDREYHKLLLKKSGEERDNFPKLKKNIYAGDEYFSRGEYEKALESYKKALANPSKLKEKILFKLLNKKATVHLKLNEFENALACFNESLNALNNDYAYFGKGVCEYELNLGGACESLECATKLKKSQLLEKGLILNCLGCHSLALETFDFILENHYRQDEIYTKACSGREFALGKLGLN